MYEELSKEAIRELLTYPQPGPVRRLKDEVKKLLGRRIPEKDPVNWPCGLLAMGLADRYRALDDTGKSGRAAEEKEEILEALKRFYDRWIHQGYPLRSVENTLAGVALCDLYEITKEDRYREGLFRMADFVLGHERDEDGSLPYNVRSGNRYIFVDMLGMVCPFAFRFGEIFRKEDPDRVRSLTDLALLQLGNYFTHGVDEETGLVYHAYVKDPETGTYGKLGLAGWGRACGWALLGLSGGLGDAGLREEDRETLARYYERLYSAVRTYRREDQLYPWHLPDRKGRGDTSATAMILLSAAMVREKGPSGDQRVSRDERELRDGMAALIKQIRGGKVMNALAECVDLGVHPQKYGSYPWSVGPTLSLLSLMNEDES